MKELTVIVLSIFLLFGCSNFKGNGYEKSVKDLIPVDLITHLPENIGTENFELTFELKPEYNDVVGYQTMIYVSYELNSIDSLEGFVKQNSIDSSRFNDKCNVVLYRYQTGASKLSIEGKEWVYENYLKELDSCSRRAIPIPNFINVGEGKFKNAYGISDDYVLYTTEAKSGKHFPDRYYSKELILPKEWKRGYSKGYAINKKENKVIYWLTIW